MLKPTDIRVGNLIQYDHDERRQPPVCMQRGWVKEIHTDGVVLTNGEKRKWERTEGLPLTDDILDKFGFDLVASDIPTYGRGFGFHDGEDYSDCVIINKDADGNLYTVCNATKIIFTHLHELQEYWRFIAKSTLEITVPESRP